MHAGIRSQFLSNRLNRLIHRHQTAIRILVSIRRLRRRMIRTDDDLAYLGLDPITSDDQVRNILGSIGELHDQLAIADPLVDIF